MKIIAEAGINHNGNIKLAKQLALEAKKAGADYIKYQTFWDIYHLKKYEFTKKQWIELKKYCDKINITFLSTPHTFEAIHFINKLVPIHKIASTYLGLLNFLIEVANKNKPILLSTGNLIHNDGMATIEEIENALTYLKNNKITLMHCVSKYPCYNAKRERELELSKLGYDIGLSDHTKNIIYDRTYSYLEKHIMLEGIDCLDECVSITPKEFKEMVDCLKSL
jgi:sialic acid synthase SpsE